MKCVLYIAMFWRSRPIGIIFKSEFSFSNFRWNSYNSCLQLFANLTTLWSSHCSRKTWFLTQRHVDTNERVLLLYRNRKKLLFVWNFVQLWGFNLLRKFRQHDNIICHLKRKLIVQHNVLPSVVDSGSSHP